MTTVFVVKAFYDANELAQAIGDLELSPMNIQGMYYGMYQDEFGESMKHILIYRSFRNDK